MRILGRSPFHTKNVKDNISIHKYGLNNVLKITKIKTTLPKIIRTSLQLKRRCHYIIEELKILYTVFDVFVELITITRLLLIANQVRTKTNY